MSNSLSLALPAYHTVIFHGVPMFRAQAWALRDYELHSGERLIVNSADRRDAVLAKHPELHLHGQQFLFDHQHDPGFFPANSPTTSSHCLRSDGNAVYREPAGHSIPKHELGIDAVNAPGGDAAHIVFWLNTHGYHATRPYTPPSQNERHHFNFTRSPAANARKRLAKKKVKRAVAKVQHHTRVKVTQVSPQLVDMVAHFEGGRGSDGKFHAYFDKAGGVWTIGYGHTQGVKPGQVWSAAKAKRELRKELNRVYAPHVAALPNKFTQAEFDALVCAIYNLGPGVLDKGRSLGDALRKTSWRTGAPTAFMVYVHAANGNIEPGLVARREAEATLFRTGRYAR